MKLIESLRQLFLKFPHVIKIIHWCLVLTSLLVLFQYESYEITPWLWTIYCINSITYFMILSVTLINHLLVKNPEILDFYFTIAGVPLYSIAAVGGIVQEFKFEPEDAQNGPTQLYLAICYIVILMYMMAQILLTIYFQKTSGIQVNEVTVENS